MIVASDTATVLRKARDLLTPDGAWMQGAYSDPERRCFCLAGAINIAAAGRPDAELDGPASIARRVVWDVLADGRPKAISPAPIEWNDTPGRTQAEVLALLDRAIAAAQVSV